MLMFVYIFDGIYVDFEFFTCTAGNFYGCERVGNPTNILNPIVSARLRTAESFSFKFGRVEIRARMPSGDWLWPAIWMLPRYQDYGQWPASGEIDIVESRGNSGLMLNGVNIGAEQVSQTLHWGPHFFLNQYEKTSWSKNSVPGYDSDFHIYGLEWTPDYISLTIDGVETGRVEPPANGFWEYGAFPAGQDNPWVGASKLAPFDQEFYFIMNLAVGGTNSFFPDEAVNSGPPKPWSNQSPQALLDFWNARGSWESTWMGEEAAMKVDYVRSTDLPDYATAMNDPQYTRSPLLPVPPPPYNAIVTEHEKQAAAQTEDIPTENLQFTNLSIVSFPSTDFLEYASAMNDPPFAKSPLFLVPPPPYSATVTEHEEQAGDQTRGTPMKIHNL
ncbi:hypothetical protein QYM36_001689 [Artemia franciscana]|uniref:GH16 domain-containing protein n=1 Tax=Artemia franciscana TaxID=6661 RepID=A0AA88LCH5_ARTSF|nr:hypothetical protein QYM36_001689 [Artemia franciscana]